MDGWMLSKQRREGVRGRAQRLPRNGNQISTAFGENTGLCGLGCLVCWLLACLMGGWMVGL